MALLHACPGCGALVPYGQPRCDRCQAAWEERAGQRDRAREYRRRAAAQADDDPRYRAFYRSREWRTLAAATLSRAGFRCERCGGVACEVHHDPPIRAAGGWEHRLDPACLHPLCTRCHNEAHRRFGAVGRGPGGGPKSFGPA